jgi:2'-5' RNA ligase
VPTLAGIFILGELTGPVADEIHAVTRRYDPKLARTRRPHITLAGSSGVGPIPPDTLVAELRHRLTPVAATTAPIELSLHTPHRFPQTNIVVLPIDPHGAIRVLHDRIATSGLKFGPARFTFSPHVTLNLYKSLTNETLRALFQVRATGPVTLKTLHVYYTSEPRPAKLLLELPLTGPGEG